MTNIYLNKKLKRNECTSDEYNIEAYKQKPSPIGLYLLNRIDYRRAAQTRINTYNKLLLAINKISALKVLHNHIPEGTVPFCFPVFIDSMDKFHNFCFKHKIEYFTWPTYPDKVKPLKQFDNLVFLPIHSDFNHSIFTTYE